MPFDSITNSACLCLRAMLACASLIGLSAVAPAQEFIGGPVSPMSIPSASILEQTQPVSAPPGYDPVAPVPTVQTTPIDPQTPSELPGFASSPIVVGLPTALMSSEGLVVVPEVQMGSPLPVSTAEMDVRWFQTQRPSAELSVPQQFVTFQESVPPPTPEAPPLGLAIDPPVPLAVDPVFEGVVQASPTYARRHTLWERWWDRCPGTGLGQERLPYSLFAIDPAQPFNNFRIRAMVARRMQLPDRAEYFWQRTLDRRGPPRGESLMDYQEGHLRMELGSKKFSSAFDVPLRATNPELNANHAGLGDMSVAVKTVMLDGEQWMLSQQFTSYFPTGSSTMGLGRGKVALEPGLLLRNRWNDRTWIHGQIKFWFPIAADPQHGGQVLNLATGFNRVLWETDTASLVPSLEFSNYMVLNGLARDASGALRRVDGDNIFYITPGMHYAIDRKGDFGLFEIGSGVSIATTTQRFSESTWMVDVRWSW